MIQVLICSVLTCDKGRQRLLDGNTMTMMKRVLTFRSLESIKKLPLSINIYHHALIYMNVFSSSSTLLYNSGAEHTKYVNSPLHPSSLSMHQINEDYELIHLLHPVHETIHEIHLEEFLVLTSNPMKHRKSCPKLRFYLVLKQY